MKTFLLALAPLSISAALVASSLATDYSKQRTLRTVAELTTSMETTNLEVTRDGEPVDMSERGGGGGSEDTRRVVQIDQMIESADGEPTKVHRTYETIEGVASSERGDRDYECPLSGVTLALTSTGDGVEVEVVEGDEPDDDAMLEGHELAFALDALLPDSDVAEGDSWDVDADDVKRALGLDLQRVLFQPAQREGGGEGRGERGGGGRGRGGRGGGGGAGGLRLLAQADWNAKATLAESDEHEGLACAVIELEFKASGEMEVREREGRRRRDEALSLPTSSLPENTYEIEIEGRLLFSKELGRPVLLELEGQVSTSSYTERDRGDVFMTVSVDRDGTFEYRVEISDEATNDE